MNLLLKNLFPIFVAITNTLFAYKIVKHKLKIRTVFFKLPLKSKRTTVELFKKPAATELKSLVEIT